MRNLAEWRGHIHNFISGALSKTDKVLDMGIGHSTTTVRGIVGENFHIMDKNPRELLAEYEPFIGNANFVQKNLLKTQDTEWVYSNLDLDTIVCAEVLEHTEDFHAAARNLTCMLKQGRIIITVPCDLGHHPGHHYGDYWRFMPTSMKTLFAGYRVEETCFKIRGSDMYYGIGAIVYV